MPPAAPADTCPTCKRPMPKEKTPNEATDESTRGKRWERLTIVCPEPADKEAIQEKLDILQARYQERTISEDHPDGVKAARFVVLDWALQEVIDRNIGPGEDGG